MVTHLLLQLSTAGEVLLQRVSILLVLALCLSYPRSLQFQVPAVELIGAVQDCVLQRAPKSIGLWLCGTVAERSPCAGAFLVHL